jgi:glycosyltransferase involved in cell wall biosynthesis
MAQPAARPGVVFVTTELGMGGAERHVELVVDALRSAGIPVEVLCVERGGPRVAGLRAAGVRVTELDAGDRWWLTAPAVVARAVRQLTRSGAAVVMTNGYSAEIVGRTAARIAGLPVVQWKHNIGHVGRFGLRDKWTERLLRPLPARVLAVSRAQVDYLTGYLDIPRDRIGCVRNVLESTGSGSTVVPVRSARADRPVVMCVAGLRVEKDHATLLRAFALVVRDHPDAVLQLVGDGPERAAVEDLIGELDLTGSVQLLGNRTDVGELLPTADVFVLSSYAVENLPFAVQEAMAAELPVVATEIGALAELVVDGVTGVLVPPHDPAALAAALGRVLADPDAARRMGQAGRDHLQREFSYDAFVTQLEQEVLRCA